MRYEVILRYDDDGYEYVVNARIRRFAGAVAERDAMVDMTRENMLEHANGARVITGAGTEPDSVTVATLMPDRVYSKTILIRQRSS